MSFEEKTGTEEKEEEFQEMVWDNVTECKHIN